MREEFPNATRYLKDFYTLKFRDLEKKSHLLRNFNSKIIKADAALLALKINKLADAEIINLYNTEDYGLSFHKIEKQLVGYTGPWLLLVSHSEKNMSFFAYTAKGRNKPLSLVPTKTGPSVMFRTTKETSADSYLPCSQTSTTTPQIKEMAIISTSGSIPFPMKGSANEGGSASEATPTRNNSNFGLIRISIKAQYTVAKIPLMALEIWLTTGPKNLMSERWSFGAWERSTTSKIRRNTGTKDNLSTTHVI
jgi:hypothetical protein